MCVCVCVRTHSFLYIHTHILFDFFSTMISLRILNIVLCSIQYAFVVYPSSVYSSLHLLIPNSQSIPLPPSVPLTNHRSFLHVSLSLSLSLCKFLLKSLSPLSFCVLIFTASLPSVTHPKRTHPSPLHPTKITCSPKSGKKKNLPSQQVSSSSD